MAAITFETVYAGLDRALTLRKDRYDSIVQKITELRDRDARDAERQGDSFSNEELKRAKENYNDLDAQAKDAHNTFVAQLAETEREIQGQRSLSPEATRLGDLITTKTQDRERLVVERDKKTTNDMAWFESQRASFDERIKLAQQRNDLETIKRLQAEEEALANPQQKIDTQYGPKIDAADREIAALRADFDKKLAEAAPMSAADRQKLEARRDDIRAQLSESDKRWQASLAVAQAQIEKAQTMQSTAATNAIEAGQRRENNRAQLDELEKERIENARLDQVRRIAARFYGAKPEDVANDKVDLVSNVWFGSLAMLAALAGPMTALVSLELQSLASRDPRDRRGSLSRLLRKWLLSWRWRRVRRLHVPVEVPVEKEVEKRVEVPVEKVVKEILYVPILSDDPEAIQRMLAATSLDREMADLVTFSLARPANGNPPQH